MSTIISVFRCKIFYVSYFLFFLLFTDVFGQTQQFFLLGKEYRFKDGKWYTLSSNGNLGDPIVPYSLIVRLKDRGYLETFDFNQLNIDGISLGSKRILDGFYGLSISQEQNPFNVASILEESDKFDVMEFDVIGERLVIPNDPLYDPHQWNLKPSHLDMPAAWEITTGDPSIILAVIDSGTEYVHEDLDGNIWINDGEDDGDGIPEFFPISQGGDIGDLDGDGDPDDDGNGYIDDLIGWDFAGGGYDPQPPFVEDNDPDDTFGHGTNVSGIASAQTNNFEIGQYVGVAGVAGGWGASSGSSLMVLRDGGATPHSQLTATAIEYAAENGAKIINISSGYASNNQYLTLLENAVNTAVNNYNVFIAASAGNNGDDPLDPSIRYPAKFPNTIAVGATDINDVRRNYSAYGAEMDAMAPDGVTSTSMFGTNNYAYAITGTSYSAPHVAGQAALLFSLDPTLSWQQVRDFIRYSADKVSGMGDQDFTYQYGYGRINVFKALLRAKGYGHITTNLTLYNDIEFKGDVIIDEGVTLTIKPGVTVAFAANSDVQNEGLYSGLGELIVKDKVNFEGTEEQPIIFKSTSGNPQSWGGIRFEDTSDDFSVITHCQIEDAFIGIHLDRASPSVNDNTLINNMWGLYLNYSAASIRRNMIRENSSNGILIYNSNAIEQDVLVENNKIFFNGSRGIYGNNSSPIITQNFIKHNNLHGIEGLNQFSAIIGSRAEQDNWISYNSGFGIRIMNASTPFLGNDEESPGQNAVYYNDNAEFYYTGGSICYAQYNYWGADPPDEEEFFTDAASEIIYDPWLSENPMMELKLTNNNSFNSNNVTHFSQDSIGNAFKQFFLYYFTGQYQSAISLAINIIHQYPRNSQIPNLLGVLWRAYIKVQNVPDFKIILSKIINKHPELPIKGWAQIILASIMTGNKDYGTALGLFELAASGFPSSGVEATAIYGQFYIYFLEVFNHVMAQNKLHELQQKYPDDPLTQNAEELFSSFPFGNVKRSMQKNSKTNQLPLKISRFELLQNYPNPFNPETNIAFHLPADNHVNLEIYDLNGRRVKTLLNNQINEGTHHAKWDGTDDSGKQVASGIYVYLLKSGRFIQSRKMLLIR